MAGTQSPSNMKNIKTCVPVDGNVVCMIFVSIMGFSSIPDTVEASRNMFKLFLFTEIQDGATQSPPNMKTCITF